MQPLIFFNYTSLLFWYVFSLLRENLAALAFGPLLLPPVASSVERRKGFPRADRCRNVLFWFSLFLKLRRDGRAALVYLHGWGVGLAVLRHFVFIS